MSVGHQSGGDSDRQSSARPHGEADWGALKEDVGEIADAAVDRGRQFIEQARDQATGYVDRRKDDVAQSVADFSKSLKGSTATFHDRPNIQAFVDGAADGLDQLAETIRSRSVSEIFNEIEGVVRRRPAAVAAVTLVAGFLVARFIKSSAEGMRSTFEETHGHPGERVDGERQRSAPARRRDPRDQG